MYSPQEQGVGNLSSHLLGGVLFMVMNIPNSQTWVTIFFGSSMVLLF